MAGTGFNELAELYHGAEALWWCGALACVGAARVLHEVRRVEQTLVRHAAERSAVQAACAEGRAAATGQRPRGYALVSTGAKETAELTYEEFLKQSAAFRRADDVQVAFKIRSEACSFLGGARAALLQVSHPFVAAGIADHSYIHEKGVQRRFLRTFYYLFRILFGKGDEPQRAAADVFRTHSRINATLRHEMPAQSIFRPGDRYSANNVEALVWVAATLADTQRAMHELYLGRLTTAELDAYTGEVLRPELASFGLAEDQVPATWHDLQLFIYSRTKALPSNQGRTMACGSNVADEVANMLFTPMRPYLQGLMDVLRTDCFFMLPPELACSFKATFAAVHRAQAVHRRWFVARVAAIRIVYAALPAALRRLTPALQHAATESPSMANRCTVAVSELLGSYVSDLVHFLLPPPPHPKLSSAARAAHSILSALLVVIFHCLLFSAAVVVAALPFTPVAAVGYLVF